MLSADKYALPICLERPNSESHVIFLKSTRFHALILTKKRHSASHFSVKSMKRIYMHANPFSFTEEEIKFLRLDISFTLLERPGGYRL